MTTTTIEVWADAAWDQPTRSASWSYFIRMPDGSTSGASQALPRPGALNRAHLTAILAALQALPDGAPVTLRTSSHYALQGITEWSVKWRKTDWQETASGSELKERDLWKPIAGQQDRVALEIRWESRRECHGSPAHQMALQALSDSLKDSFPKRAKKVDARLRACLTRPVHA
jgi:ribonuclease HI